MSAEFRQTLADAVSAIDGLNCTPTDRQSIKAGDACVRLDRITRDTSGFGYMKTWQVLIGLPTGVADAERYLDDRITELLDVVNEHLVVTGAQPRELDLGTTTVPALVIEGTRPSGN